MLISCTTRIYRAISCGCGYCYLWPTTSMTLWARHLMPRYLPLIWDLLPRRKSWHSFYNYFLPVWHRILPLTWTLILVGVSTSEHRPPIYQFYLSPQGDLGELQTPTFQGQIATNLTFNPWPWTINCDGRHNFTLWAGLLTNFDLHSHRGLN